MKEILEFITQEAYIMIPVLWVLGFIIKNTELIKDKYIPLILLAVSLLLSPWMLGGYNAQNVIQAILVAGGAVLADNLYRQSKKEE